MSITRPLGFRAAGTTAGIKPSGKPDLCLILRDSPDSPGTGSASVFTRNQILGSPVIVGRRIRDQILRGESPPQRAILVNAGNSNAATGDRGIHDAEASMAAVAAAVRCSPTAVLPSSTGVIGRLLPVEKILAKIPSLAAALARGEAADDAAAAAIMTTDLVPKLAFNESEIDGHLVRVGAIAKGSGMIAPRLDSAAPTPAKGTMLAFITTDAAIASPELQAALNEASGLTFDRISVDNHPSCSDTVAVLSSGLAEAAPGRGALAAMSPIQRGTPAFAEFTRLLRTVCECLAEQIVTDGEGATRTFRVEVSGTATRDDAERIAREIVNSPLVKCAIHGRDPNWGRIVTAAGNAGITLDAARMSLTIGPVEVYKAGMPITAALTDPRLKEAMAAKRVECRLTVGPGPASAWMIGCDLSAQYVSINADYTT
jgi:glutamate N-acetyltransferase / amino-acid N-acetyltransferase